MTLFVVCAVVIMMVVLGGALATSMGERPSPPLPAEPPQAATAEPGSVTP